MLILYANFNFNLFGAIIFRELIALSLQFYSGYSLKIRPSPPVPSLQGYDFKIYPVAGKKNKLDTEK